MTALEYVYRDILHSIRRQKPSFWTVSPITYKAILDDLRDRCAREGGEVFFDYVTAAPFVADTPIFVERVLL